MKNPSRLQTMTFKLFYKGDKTKLRKEKSKVTFSVALVMAFLADEKESGQLEDFPHADLGRLLKGLFCR